MQKQQSPSLIFGLIGGVATIVAMLLFYIIDADMLTGFGTLIAYQAIVVLCMVLAANEARKRNDGTITFKGALKSSYGAAVIALLFFVIFYFILYKYVDPNLIVAYKKKSMERAVEWMQKQGKSQQEINAVLDQAQKQDYSPNLKFTVMIYAFYAILSFFYALGISGIMALAFRNKQAENYEANS